jgi:hypothetical protein
LADTFYKVSIASLLMGIGCFYVHHWVFSAGLGRGILWEGIALAISILVGIIILLSSSKILRISELDMTLNLMKARFKKLGAIQG